MKRKALFTCAMVILLASLGLASPVLAHALLQRSIPAANAELSQAPARIELWFTEPLEAGFSSMRLLDGNGQEIALGPQDVDAQDPAHLSADAPQLAPGVYTLAWRSLSRADGHEWFGNFPFVVLNADGSRPAGAAAPAAGMTQSGLPGPLQTLARWLGLSGGILMMGAALFLGLVAVENMRASAKLEARLNRMGLGLLGLAALGLLVGSALQFAAQAGSSLALLLRVLYATHAGALAVGRLLFGLEALLMGLLLLTPSRKPWLVGLAAALVVALLGLELSAGMQGETWLAGLALALTAGLAWLTWRAQRQPLSAPARWRLLLLPGGAVLVCFSFGSHAAGVPGSFWAVVFDLLHLLASAAWLGGLLLLPLMLDRHRQVAGGPDTSALRPLFRRYGMLAKLAFFLLLSTGLFNSLVHFPDIASVVNSPYGQALLLKLGLMLAVWVISLHSSRLFRGRPDPARVETLFAQFTRQVRGAGWLGLGLMLVVAVLVQTQPPVRSSAADEALGYHNLLEIADLNVHVQVSPAQVGFNRFFVQLSPVDGSSIGDVQLARLLFDAQDAQLGQSKIDLKALGGDVFGVDGAFLNQPGHWQLSLYLRRRGMDDVLTPIGTISLPPPVSPSPFQNPVSTLPESGLLAGGLAIVGVELLRWRQTVQRERPGFYTVVLYTAGALIVIGLVLGVYIFL